MRRSPMLTLTVGLIGAVIALAAGPAFGRANQVTPEAAPSILAETLASAPVPDRPGQALLQLRVTLAPGAVVPPHIHPGDLVFSVESGTLGYTVLAGSVPVSWAGAGTPIASEALDPGTEVILQSGDWLSEPSGTLHITRNPGDMPTVLLISALVAADQPFLQPMPMVATPTA